MSVVRKLSKANKNPWVQNGQMLEPNRNTGHVALNLISDGEHSDKTMSNNCYNQLHENYTTYRPPPIMIDRRSQLAQIIQYPYATSQFVRNRDRVAFEIISIFFQELIAERTIFVRNLPTDITHNEIINFFSYVSPSIIEMINGFSF